MRENTDQKISKYGHFLKYLWKVFPDNALLFSNIKDIDESNIEVNNDLVKTRFISEKFHLILA